jgi:hypothetical protein
LSLSNAIHGVLRIFSKIAFFIDSLATLGSLRLTDFALSRNPFCLPVRAHISFSRFAILLFSS